MKNKDFNKIGDTTLRTHQPVIDTITILDWIQFIKDGNNRIGDWDSAFVKFCNDQQIYSYKQNEAFKRFGLFKTVVCSKLNILSNSLDFVDDVEDINVNYIFEKAQKNYLPFKKTIDFLSQNRVCDAKKLFLCFAVCEEDENIEDIYNMSFSDIFRTICWKSIEENFVDFNNPTIEECENFLLTRKPISVKETVMKIIAKKMSNQHITASDFNEYDASKDKHLKPIFKEINNGENPSLNFMINKINLWSLQTFLKNIKISIDRNTLFGSGDYFTLFVYWMHDFKLTNETGKATSKFCMDNVFFDNSKLCFQIIYNDSTIEYPFTREQVCEILEKIGSNNYSFKFTEKFSSLKFVPNAAIAEYFTNLYFCYQYNIEPSKFKQYVNTKVTDNLFPIFTAPGGVPDMHYFDGITACTIETTIHSTESLIRNNEFFPCFEHLKNVILNYDAEIAKIILVSRLTKKQMPNLCNYIKTFGAGYSKQDPTIYSKLVFPEFISFSELSVK